MTVLSRPVAVGAALVLDRVIPEPPNRWHPVAWFGSTMTKLEHRIWSDDRDTGLGYTICGVALGVAAGTLVRSTTIALTVALGGGGLRNVAHEVAEHLEASDIDTARRTLPSLVGRNPSELDESGISAAVVESVAENTVDAVVAPLFWALVAGAPGALGYRAINTMDAMVGHRNERFEQFGWASARLDDAANWIPARLFAASVWLIAGRRRASLVRAVRDDSGAHPSPNAGVAEAAVAGALDVQLGGTLRYGERVEHRPLLGDGQRPSPEHIRSATRLVDRAVAALAGAALAGTYLRQRVKR